jgi:electron transport complex protein RnfE
MTHALPNSGQQDEVTPLAVNAEAATPSIWASIRHNGLWKQNAGVVQILGMCPVLAVSGSVVNALSLGLATTLVTALSSGLVASVRHWIPKAIRNPVFILIIAALVTCIDLLMNAYLHELYLVLGIFIPLITTNCIVMARAEVFASKNGVLPSAYDGLMMGLGLTGVLVLLGGLRESLGKGTLLSGLDLIFGDWGAHLTIHLVPADSHYQFLMMSLPPGAFIGLGLLIAVFNAINLRRQAK